MVGDFQGDSDDVGGAFAEKNSALCTFEGK